MSRSAKPHYRNRVDASVSGGELESGVDPEGAFVLRARLPR